VRPHGAGVSGAQTTITRCTAGSTGEHTTAEQDSKARSTHQTEGNSFHKLKTE